MKKILSLITAGSLTFSMMGSALAVDNQYNSGGKVTVTFGSQGWATEYEGYRILDVDVKETVGDDGEVSDGKYSYTVPAAMREVWKNTVVAFEGSLTDGLIDITPVTTAYSKLDANNGTQDDERDFDRAIIDFMGLEVVTDASSGAKESLFADRDSSETSKIPWGDENLIKFGNEITKQIKASEKNAVDFSSLKQEVEVAANADTQAELIRGYWVFNDVTADANINDPKGDKGSRSVVVLNTLYKDNLRVDPKTSVPTLDKTVTETNDTTGTTTAGQTVADYDIGDKVPFQLVGTIANSYYTYKSYAYIINDQMEHLTFCDGTADGEAAYAPTITVYPSMQDFEGDTDRTGGTKALVAADLGGKYGFKVIWDNTTKMLKFACADLKQLVDASGSNNAISLDKDSVIVVNYYATLDADAKVGDTGNKNTANITYSSNPTYRGDPRDPDKPEDPKDPEDPDDPKDETKTTINTASVVFTYRIVVSKTDKQSGQPLEGAEFTLYKLVPGEGNTQVWEEGIKFNAVNNEPTRFTFNGIDAGIYKISETKVPTGYTGANDILFEVKSSLDFQNVTDDDGNPVTIKTENIKLYTVTESEGKFISSTEPSEELSYNVSDLPKTNGEGNTENSSGIQTTVPNNPGNPLPSTGGMGTTLLYIGGAVFIIAAGAFLFLRKKKLAMHSN